MKALSELIDTEQPGWPMVLEWLSAAKNPVEVLPADSARVGEVLTAIQVTTRSPMGAITYSSGGFLIDHGWLRVLGSGHPHLRRTLASWNGLNVQGNPRLPGAFLIADDVMGGFFALNGGAFSGPLGHVHYFAPDTLDWEDTGKGYSGFVQWACSSDLCIFYGPWRWPGWHEEIQSLSGDQGISVYPFLWAEGSNIAERSRAIVPVEELWGMQMDFKAQMAADERKTKSE